MNDADVKYVSTEQEIASALFSGLLRLEDVTLDKPKLLGRIDGYYTLSNEGVLVVDLKNGSQYVVTVTKAVIDNG
jgi:hypothetical protein